MKLQSMLAELGIKADAKPIVVIMPTLDIGRILGALWLGAGIMYFYDPEMGNRRRALVRDQAVKAAHRGLRWLNGKTDYLVERAHGQIAELRRTLRWEWDLSNQKLVARVRAELGHVVAHARQINVVADGGRITLRGHVLSREHALALATVEGIKGVAAVDDQLMVHEEEALMPGTSNGPAGDQA